MPGRGHQSRKEGELQGQGTEPLTARGAPPPGRIDLIEGVLRRATTDGRSSGIFAYSVRFRPGPVSARPSEEAWLPYHTSGSPSSMSLTRRVACEALNMAYDADAPYIRYHIRSRICILISDFYLHLWSYRDVVARLHGNTAEEARSVLGELLISQTAGWLLVVSGCEKASACISRGRSWDAWNRSHQCINCRTRVTFCNGCCSPEDARSLFLSSGLPITITPPITDVSGDPVAAVWRGIEATIFRPGTAITLPRQKSASLPSCLLSSVNFFGLPLFSSSSPLTTTSTRLLTKSADRFFFEIYDSAPAADIPAAEPRSLRQRRLIRLWS